ncbi:hypothetical protein GALL_280590 [mine drainage metagenome]|uniref:Uncharacterized protein n=1 Tax=mine drainage metagenome TaxID=410659 RepID=A0A1J5RD67_9ZZZZ
MADEEERKSQRVTPTVSRRLPGGGILELIYQVDTHRTAFVVVCGGEVSVASSLDTDTGERLVPVPATNNLIKHGALLLPDKPEPYGSTGELIEAVQAYLFRYVDLSERFQRIASYYILLTWVYDAFNELPYLRLRGDFGSGKTRALIVIGSLCYKTFFASGASTVSPIFHTLDTFRGTLIFDEADFRFSDEKSELVKIFNNGNAKGFPVLRTAMTIKKEFDPRAFNVFGPKIVAMRRSFEDQALESRFLTEEMGQRSLRGDIPINLPDAQKEEARSLRNRLLMYRFQSLERIKVDASLVDPSLSPRLNQILVPLLSIIDDEQLQEEVRDSVKSFDQDIYAERSGSAEAGILEILSEMLSAQDRTSIPVSEVTVAFVGQFGGEYDRPITNRFIGGILRKRLRLSTYKSHGVYVVPATEKPKVDQLCIRYGVIDRGTDTSKEPQ